jgi:hypothetical protein
MVKHAQATVINLKTAKALGITIPPSEVPPPSHRHCGDCAGGESWSGYANDLIASRILPMELRIGDRLVDETGEWDVTGPLYRSPDGKNAGARVRKVGRPDVTEIRTWGAHERVAVRRATTEKGKR